MGKSRVDPLPESYTTIKEISLPSQDIFLPALNCDLQTERPSLDRLIADEYIWLDNVKSLLDKGSLEVEDFISWAAYNASQLGPPNVLPMKSTMLPLFRQTSSNPMMVIMECI